MPTGTLRIAEVQQAGYRQTFPAAPGIHTVTLTAGQTVTGINFGNQAIVAQAVGTKWLDTDGDGVKDAGEPGIAGVWIYVDLDQDGRIDTGEPATVTNQFGQYTLALPGAGTYQLREVLGPGYVQTFPGGNGAHTVTVTGTETVGRDFGNMPAFDYGDAPVDYVALTLAGEARHGVLQGFHLGAAVDGESGPQSSNDALGDDNAGQDDGTGTNTIIDDEDGVIIPGPFYIGKTGSVTVNVETGSIAPGMLQGWIDYNRDGVWSDNEQIVKNRTLGTGSHVVTFTVPTTNTVVGNTFARFRYSHIAGLGPLGSAPTGEVEDYQVLLLEDRPNANDDTDSVLQDSVANPIPVLANDFSSSTGILNITAAGNNGQSANLGVVTISANKQTIFYSPRPGFFGTDTFTYTVTDGANHFDTATVTVTVLPNFENPVAVDDSFSVTEGSSNRLDVLANDIQGRTPPINIVS
ncbi:MAG: hypothetical protein KDA47_18225, partial [Planctomycetales bacterium]|nr:hypothetical protein [Planctomycetales bacterium]